ncbi:MAG: virulence protein [Burkholderiales bacterium RIFCSPLOWO2_12_FULL_61_40]|nr:MAG: virulence protein [Burkholderiales bacterium RIFCSPLOWO2_12_FULL_61_40]
MLTRVFKSGNSLAVRIPKELGFVDAAQEVEIERVGNTLVLRPVVQETIGDLTEICAAFPKSFMAEGREVHEEHERDWSGLGRADKHKVQG